VCGWLAGLVRAGGISWHPKWQDVLGVAAGTQVLVCSLAAIAESGTRELSCDVNALPPGIAALPLEGGHQIHSLAFSPSGEFLATGSADGASPPSPPPFPAQPRMGHPILAPACWGAGTVSPPFISYPPPLHMPASRRRIRGLILADDHFSHWGGTCVWRNTAAAKLNDGVQHDYTALDSLVDQGSRGVP
jgi:hypothetical protein